VQHEHRNLISTIAGLLFLKRYDHALDLIQQQSESHQKVIDFIARNFQDNHLAGLLIGKYYRAKELGLELIFDPACFVDRLPPPFRTMNGSRSWGIYLITPTMPACVSRRVQSRSNA
jgi:sensor histidine kinase regulating citrate/malate metabolism